MMMRIVLFLATNFAVMIVLGIILSVTGIAGNSTGGILIMALLFGFAGSLISLFLSKTMALRSVGAEVITNPRNNAEQWLVNTVQRQAQQAGIPMPDVAIYHSHDVNAFATGATKNNSLVAVSTGLLNAMTQDEAEAVIAHEVSHIANGDMVTMTLLQGVLNTFVIFLSRIIASAVSNSRNDDGSESHSSGIYFLVSMVLEIIFGILASIIAMWFSRYREFRADAGSASLVGKEKMIAALQRLQSIHEPQEMTGSLNAFMINGKRNELFMSHPPLEKRIEALRNI
ncbi:protease HtpX [Otariodibacter sp.]|uniref:protease HtpX n=1 Tax=Otariodibacter sp. TaxID=3030919 RepID=UPI00261260C8|nr:protease HtpX [Otariodibacter sp.]